MALTFELKVYVGAMIPLIARIGGSLVGSQSQKIFYKKPNGVTGYWTASIQEINDGHVVYNTQKTDLDVSGLWVFQGWEKDASDRENHGQAYSMEIFSLGN